MAADDAGEAVQGQHGALAGAAAGDDVVGSAAVQQDGGEDAALHIGQLGGVIGGIHTVVDHLVAHRLHDLLQSGLDDAVLCGLTVLVDECDLHGENPPVSVNLYVPFRKGGKNAFYITSVYPVGEEKSIIQ